MGGGIYNKINAFTLIELLAIIVILAIIAVITVPIILNVIENAKKGAAVDSAYGYKDAIEKYYVTKLSEDSDFNLESGDYSVNDVGITSQSGTLHTIPTSGIVPSGGYISIENNAVKTACIVIDEYKIELQNGEFVTTGKGECEKTYKKYNDGDVIYFNPYDTTNIEKSGKECTLEEYTANTDASKTGNNEGCMKFYAFLDSETSSTINLILDHNTTATVAWYHTSSTNAEGPSKVDGYLLDILKLNTENWTGVEIPNPESYKPLKMFNNGTPYTIDYSDYNARLISAEEVNRITDLYSETRISSSYFDSTCNGSDKCTEGENNYGWLFDNTANTGSYTCTKYGCNTGKNTDPNGYWTSTPSDSIPVDAWGVIYDGSLSTKTVLIPNEFGVRPVITVSKSKLTQ